MEANWRWWNPSHPQTLKIAVALAYFNALFSLLNLGQASASFQALLGVGFLGVLLALALVAANIGAAVGMANDKKLWYRIAFVLAGLSLVLPVIAVITAPAVLLNPMFLFNLVFPIAFVVALAHPMTRDFVKVWFG